LRALVHDDTDLLLATKLHRHAIADADVDFLGQGVLEKFLQRHVERHPRARKFPVRQGLIVCG
jgi:hypothetical protein